jgi:hypothetical protein
MAAWDRHKPGTSNALLDLLTTAHTGRTRFSHSQRALFTACEFWAASQNGSLSAHLGNDIESRLEAAETSFVVIGLPKTARILKRARMQLGADSPAPTKRVIQEIEDALTAIDEPIDDTFEHFATHVLQAE